MSGNTSGSRTYSDLKYEVPMMPNRIDTCKCPSCGTFHYVMQLTAVLDGSLEKEQCSELKPLTIEETVEFLNTPNISWRTFEVMKSTRINLLRLFNDRIREDQPNDERFVNSDDEKTWKENNEILLDILEDDKEEESYLKAEILRYNNQFNEAYKVLNTITEMGYEWAVSQVINQCRKRNNKLIILNT
jgi:hypothetical protein